MWLDAVQIHMNKEKCYRRLPNVTISFVNIYIYYFHHANSDFFLQVKNHDGNIFRIPQKQLESEAGIEKAGLAITMIPSGKQ